MLQGKWADQAQQPLYYMFGGKKAHPLVTMFGAGTLTAVDEDDRQLTLDRTDDGLLQVLTSYGIAKVFLTHDHTAGPLTELRVKVLKREGTLTCPTAVPVCAGEVIAEWIVWPVRKNSSASSIEPGPTNPLLERLRKGFLGSTAGSSCAYWKVLV